MINIENPCTEDVLSGVLLEDIEVFLNTTLATPIFIGADNEICKDLD